MHTRASQGRGVRQLRRGGRDDTADDGRLADRAARCPVSSAPRAKDEQFSFTRVRGNVLRYVYRRRRCNVAVITYGRSPRGQCNGVPNATSCPGDALNSSPKRETLN